MRRSLPLSVLLILLLVLGTAGVDGAHGYQPVPSGSLCGSCGHLPRREAGTFGFTKLPLGVPIAASFTVDPDHDGLWEIAIRTAETPAQVGVFSPKSGLWVDGPRSLAVIDDEWGVGDWNRDGGLEYVYRVGPEIRHHDPVSGTDSLLWTVPVTPLNSVFWGYHTPGADAVALLYQGGTVLTGLSWAWGVRDLWTGQHIRNIPGEPYGLRRMNGHARPSDQWLIIHAASSSIDQTSHTGSQRYYQSIRVVDSNWSVASTTTLPGASRQGSNPILMLWGLTEATIVRRGTPVQNLVFWMVAPVLNGLESSTTYFGAAWATGGSAWYTACNYGTRCMSTSLITTRAVGYDLDRNGIDEVIAPNWRDTTWQIWNAATGALDSVIPDRPSAKLDAATLLQDDKRDLFYLADSSLYIYSSDVTTGVFDDPEGPQHPVVNLTLAAHPNPFNSAVTLTWSELAPVPSSIAIYNVLGQSVFEASVDGQSQVTWDGCDSEQQQCPSGIYIARMTAVTLSATTKIVLLR